VRNLSVESGVFWSVLALVARQHELTILLIAHTEDGEREVEGASPTECSVNEVVLKS
jgi:hypothetical protein